MSVLIRGMYMPKCCNDCELCDGGICLVLSTGSNFAFNPWPERGRVEDCPLIEVPPHGDLIDRDALTDAMERTDWYHQAKNKEMAHGANSNEHQAWYKEQDIYTTISNAPTIIPAEEGET